MSWDAHKEHMDTYREQRVQALNNEEKQHWFTTPVGSIPDLVDIFDRKTENETWEAEYNDKADLRKLQGSRIKIAALCSATRDVRSQFAAWSSKRVRVPLDWDRYEYMRCGFNYTKLDHLDKVVTYKENTPLPELA